ncbi:MAG: response regulator transcription factor [Clostridiales bacterium]|nr:response regulator transcription factor [Clostridiales bacterium]
MKRVLVAEDEASIREFIVINLQRSGYDVTEAADGAQALSEFESSGGDFDVAVLDIMMPEVDGLEVCKRLREESRDIGIIILTAKTQEMDKVTGLLMGADDYVTKPFSPSELMARVDAVYRRVAISREHADEAPTDSILTSGEFTLNLRNRTLSKNGKPIELTQVEFQIMEYFFMKQGAALTRADILTKAWGNEYYKKYTVGEEKIVDVNIRRLRMKVEDVPSEPKHLITVWGVGYKWVS